MNSISNTDYDYDKTVEEIVVRYKVAASKEKIYLLHSTFPFLREYMQIQCG